MPMLACHSLVLSLVASTLSFGSAVAGERVLDPRMHHLRVAGEREWSDFPLNAEGPTLTVRFQASKNAAEQSLRFRQQDVKQTWKILLNGKELDRLRTDENDMVVYSSIPAGRLVDGENALVIEQAGKTPDDIRVGEIVLDDRPVAQTLNEASVEVLVFDVTRRDSSLTPCRITVLASQGTLMTTGVVSNEQLAVRPGVIYCSTGKARFGLPAGEYTIYAGRGFEYSLDSVKLTLRPGDHVTKRLSIRREVPSDGYVSCDTHVHTLTYSGHGDCTVAERVITLAGEGIELPITTEHNRQDDYHAAAVKHAVRDCLTPVVGNEVTTSVGHFNVFPVPAGGPVPDFGQKTWKGVFQGIHDRTRADIIILNHGRDVHNSFQPLGPKHHIAVTGENLDGWVLEANAMEVVNSGAQRTDILRLHRDWFGLLNRGLFLTPIGASDSHDVSRYIVGQGRTYVRCKDDKPGSIDVQEAVASLRAGRVMVSCGLLSDLTVNDKYGSGDLVPPSDEVRVAVRVLGPSWTKAERIELYANGVKIREARITDGQRPGVKWAETWTLPRFRHDVHLVAIATGPGVSELYWPIAKPYQPVSPQVQRQVIGSSGAVWLDADGDGRRTSAFDYARRLVPDGELNLPKVPGALRDYDEAVAAQAASRLQARGVALHDAELRAGARKAGPHVERGFQAFSEAWRESQIARSQPPLK